MLKIEKVPCGELKIGPLLNLAQNQTYSCSNIGHALRLGLVVTSHVGIEGRAKGRVKGRAKGRATPLYKPPPLCRSSWDDWLRESVVAKTKSEIGNGMLHFTVSSLHTHRRRRVETTERPRENTPRTRPRGANANNMATARNHAE